MADVIKGFEDSLQQGDVQYVTRTSESSNKHSLDVSLKSAATSVTIGTTSAGEALLLDEPVAGTTYLCKAPPGTLTSAAAWQVERLTETGTTLRREWADGNNSYDNICDNRLSLSYS